MLRGACCVVHVAWCMLRYLPLPLPLEVNYAEVLDGAEIRYRVENLDVRALLILRNMQHATCNIILHHTTCKHATCNTIHHATCHMQHHTTPYDVQDATYNGPTRSHPALQPRRTPTPSTGARWPVRPPPGVHARCFSSLGAFGLGEYAVVFAQAGCADAVRMEGAGMAWWGMSVQYRLGFELQQLGVAEC